MEVFECRVNLFQSKSRLRRSKDRLPTLLCNSVFFKSIFDMLVSVKRSEQLFLICFYERVIKNETNTTHLDFNATSEPHTSP